MYLTFNVLLISRVSASKQSINLEYAPFLRNYILEPLQKSGSEGAKASLDRLNDYELLKEDLDSINEICNWPNMPDPLSSLDSKVCMSFNTSAVCFFFFILCAYFCLGESCPN